MSTGRPEPHTLSGAYALDALTPADRARFERHLARCEQCDREVMGLREAAARLAGAAAAAPPAGLSARVLAAAARTRQLPPAIPVTPARAAGWRSRFPGRAGALPRRAWMPGLALAVTAGALVLAAIVGVAARSAEHRVAGDQRRSLAIAAVLTAPDATMLTARVSGGGTVTVVMSGRERAFVLAAAGLRRLPASRRYELWLMAAGGDEPAGMLTAASDGMTGPALTTGVSAGEHIGLSVEPAAGTAHPTSAMVVVLAL